MTASPSLLDLLDSLPAPSHRNDPQTSREAAPAGPRLGGQRRAVLLALAAAVDGLTGHQACALTTCMYPSGATTRIEELCRLGLAEPSERTRATPTGRLATVWFATDAGRELAGELS